MSCYTPANKVSFGVVDRNPPVCPSICQHFLTAQLLPSDSKNFDEILKEGSASYVDVHGKCQRIPKGDKGFYMLKHCKQNSLTAPVNFMKFFKKVSMLICGKAYSFCQRNIKKDN